MTEWTMPHANWTKVLGGPITDLVKGASLPVSKPVKIPPVKVVPPSLAFVPMNRDEFCNCEYDLGEIARAADTASFISQSILKHKELCLKEGFEIVSKDTKTLEYVKQRLFQMELATGRSFGDLLDDISRDLIKFANVFLVFRRDEDLSPGRSYRKYGKDVEPVAGVFLADPSTMRIRRNRWGEPKEYEQCIEGDHGIRRQEKKFDPLDVLHISFDKKTGFAWGTPWLVPVLDDVRMWRNLEEIAVMVCHKGAFPFYHYQVGTDDLPAQDTEDGSSEIRKAEENIRMKEATGIFITSHRHKITAVDGNAAVKDLTKYLEYAEQLVISGLNLSGVDLGRGQTANRGTATQMSKSLQSRCKEFQKTISEGLQSFFDDLLQEGGFPLSQSNRVSLFWPEIDVETQQIVQNHRMAMYQGHMLSFEEARKDIGRDPVVNEADMYFNKIEVPRIKEQAKAKAAAAPATASQKSTASKNKPTNKSGTKPARTRPTKDALEAVDRIVMSVAEHIVENGIPEETRSLPDKLADILSLVLGDILPRSTDEIRMALRPSCQVMFGVKEDSAPILINCWRGMVKNAVEALE